MPGAVEGTLGDRLLAFLDHLEHCSHGHLAVLERSLVGLDLQGLVDRKLALDPALGNGKCLVKDDVEG